MYQPDYDPRQHADEMNVQIIYHSLRDNYGVWVPERRIIIIDRNCPAHMQTPVLAHECDHAQHNDPAGHHARKEARANLNSARRLISPSEFDALTVMYPDYDRICLELGVTREQFTAYATWRKSETLAVQEGAAGDTVNIADVVRSGLLKPARTLVMA